MRESDQGGANEFGSSLSVVCSFWKDFDLEGMRAKLDEVGLKIAGLQEESVQNRRKLAEVTKDFRRNTPESAAKSVGTLLKQYQEEVDRLTKRAKHGESAFLNVYQKLYEAPDPALALSQAFETASRLTDLEAQNRKVNQELAEYKAESKQIKNQDLTIRRLEEKVRSLEAQLEEKEREVVEVKEQASAEADAAVISQMQEKEQQLTQMLNEAQENLAAMHRLQQTTQNQLFAMQSQTEEEKLGRQSELELQTQELERAQERLIALEQEKASLKQQLGARKDSQLEKLRAAPPVPTLEEALRQELGTQRELSSRLRSEVASLKHELEEANEMWATKLEGLRATLQATTLHSQALEEELAMRPTVVQVEELKQQIRILQAVGYNTLENDGGPAGGRGGVDAARSSGGGAAGSTLESLLLSKNRHLEHELTMCRLKVVDAQQELDMALARVTELEGQVAEQRSLVRQLEEDLLVSRRQGGDESGTGPRRASSDARQLSGLLGAVSAAAAAVGSDGDSDADDADNSMVRVLCAQRDRFRVRAQELEEELTRSRADLAAARNQAAAVQADNVALIERLRYVHGYKAGPRADVERGESEVERRYSAQYEDKLNPFREFQGQQKERSRRAMSLPDRAMYSVAQLVFGSPVTRAAVFAYLLLLHLLVFAALTRMTHHGSGALFAHHQAILDAGRHHLTQAMHGEPLPGAALAPRLGVAQP